MLELVGPRVGPKRRALCALARPCRPHLEIENPRTLFPSILRAAPGVSQARHATLLHQARERLLPYCARAPRAAQRVTRADQVKHSTCALFKTSSALARFTEVGQRDQICVGDLLSIRATRAPTERRVALEATLFAR